MRFNASPKQAGLLEGLAYWRAELAYTRERFPGDADEIRRADDTIRYDLDLLDQARVPYWVQNAVLCWAEEWRNVYRETLRAAMAARSITL